MSSTLVHLVYAGLWLSTVAAAAVTCPTSSDCTCGGSLDIELRCNVGGNSIKINFLQDIYLIIKCENEMSIDYNKLPKLNSNRTGFIKSVTFKECPLPKTSFKDALTSFGIAKTISLIYQNSKNLSVSLDRQHFAGLQDLAKLLLSVNGVHKLPDDLFLDLHNLTWLNLKSNGLSISEKLFKPLERLETLEISHNHMTNISSSLFSHLSFLRKLSLWQSNVTRFSKDLFMGTNVLEELDLSSNGLNELPESLFHPLRKLKKVTLFSNKFSSLPEDLFKSNNYLDTVVIFNNDVKLKMLPYGMLSKLSNLKEVYIQRCQLEVVPFDLFSDSSNITNISLAYNDIEILPEAIFNDQINLQELDLSHNNIVQIEEKLFSSLVRLEILNLSHNLVSEITGSTFNSLLSLIYLDMQHNKLKTISTYLFSFSKRSLSINMAYNQLDFNVTTPCNNSLAKRERSPFSDTYNLRLLNLSHNNFRVTFDDWWFNGHEILDFSYNNITQLWNPVEILQSGVVYTRSLNKCLVRSLRQISISNNPLECNCQSLEFLQLFETKRTKGAEIDQLHCRFMQVYFCDDLAIIYIIMIPLCIIIYIIIIVFICTHRDVIKHFAKIKLYYHKVYDVEIVYSKKDEEFVLQELLPELSNIQSIRIIARPHTNHKPSRWYILESLKKYFKCPAIKLIVFSSSYLTEKYKEVDIKKIKWDMVKNTFALYLFLEKDADDSIYTFLREQRNLFRSLIWNEPHFWLKLRSFIFENEPDVIANNTEHRHTKSKKEQQRLSKLVDSPHYTLDTLNYSHV